MKHKKWDYCISKGEDGLDSEMFSIFEKGKDKDDDSIAGLWFNNRNEKRIAEPQAKLISKSPEMLEALKDVIKDSFGYEPISTDTLNKIRSILKEINEI